MHRWAKAVTNLSAQEAVEALIHGPGFVIYTDLYTPAFVDQVRARVYDLAQSSATTRPHDNKQHISEDTGHSNIYTRGKRSTTDSVETVKQDGARVWNLANKGQEFERLVQEPKVMAIGDLILGQDFGLGSYAANIMYPGSSRQLPHLDYPYWDYNVPGSWPRRPCTSGAILNLQSVLMLDEFTSENGATAILPHSQTSCRWPDLAEFEAKAVRVTGPPGTMFLFTGLLHHAAMDNRSTSRSRGAILGQYLPKYVRPMEDPAMVGAPVRARATDKLLSLLGANQPYPKNFDE